MSKEQHTKVDSSGAILLKSCPLLLIGNGEKMTTVYLRHIGQASQMLQKPVRINFMQMQEWIQETMIYSLHHDLPTVTPILNFLMKPNLEIWKRIS